VLITEGLTLTPRNSSSICGLGGAGAGAPWDRFGDALEHLMVAPLMDLGPRWPLADTREQEAEAGKGRDASAAAAAAELVAAMALRLWPGLFFLWVGTWPRRRW